MLPVLICAACGQHDDGLHASSCPLVAIKRCADCHFSAPQQQSDGSNILFCRHSPPTCVPVIHSQTNSPDDIRAAALRGVALPPFKQVQVMRSLWPAMSPEDWCHRFAPALQPSH